MGLRVIDPDRKSKPCSLCGEDKVREGYYANKANKDGLSSMCKECQCIFSTLRVYSKMAADKLHGELASAKKKQWRIRRFLDGDTIMDIARDERQGKIV